jgi:hypothetical protein
MPTSTRIVPCLWQRPSSPHRLESRLRARANNPGFPAVRDSIAIAASLSAISADSAARQAATLDRARELLATPSHLPEGAPGSLPRRASF